MRPLAPANHAWIDLSLGGGSVSAMGSGRVSGTHRPTHTQISWCVMLTRARHVAERAAAVLRNPYLSWRGKIMCLIERPWKWSRAELHHGWTVEFSTDEDRDTFYDVFFREAYGHLPYVGATVIDVGGHKGYFAIYALLRGARRVIVLECEPANIAAIQQLVATNRLSEGIRLVPKAVWSEPGTVELHLAEENWAHSLLRPSSNGRTIKVQATTLVEVLYSEPRSGPVVVKSNCEGAETEVFRKIPDSVCAMLIQYHAWASEPLERFREQLLAQGFVTELLCQNEEHANLFCTRAAYVDQSASGNARIPS